MKFDIKNIKLPANILEVFCNQLEFNVCTEHCDSETIVLYLLDARDA